MNSLLDQLRVAKQTKDAILLENTLDFKELKKFNSLHTDILCELFHENWHECQEDIIMTLENIKDPKTTDFIYSTALSIPKWDEGRSLAKKCIWALKSINTSESIAKIKLLAKSDDWIIKEFAELNLGI